MNPVRRLLNLLLCLLLALNGAALAHAGAASGPARGAHFDAGQVDRAAAHGTDADAAPCHGAPEPDAPQAAMPVTAMSDASDAPCCDDAAACDRACMPAAAALVPDRALPAADRLQARMPMAAMHARAPPRALPPIRPPIG